MYTQYSKPPIDDQKPSAKKSKKKNTNTGNKVYLDPVQDPYNPRPYPSESLSKDNSSTTKSDTLSDEDYINDLSEYQEEMLNAAFIEENPEFQFELSNTCNDLVEFFKEKNLNSESECEYDSMMKICQDNARWFMPIQAAYIFILIRFYE